MENRMDSKTSLTPGDWVEAKSLEQISRTLDADGTLDGLPFNARNGSVLWPAVSARHASSEELS